MATQRTTRELAIILHADVVGSTSLVQRNETLAHDRIRDAFQRFTETISAYGGTTQEVRGDALLATFGRASDAVSASLSFQAGNTHHNEALADDIRPEVRIGIALGEVVIADGTLTGPDVVVAQRVEQLAHPGGICIQGTAYDTIPRRMQIEYRNLGEQVVKGFDDPVRVYAVELNAVKEVPPPEHGRSVRRGPGRNLVIGVGVALLLVVAAVITWMNPWMPDVTPADLSKLAHPLPDKPSIAVLPFKSLSSDKDKEYFADGITEDIITDLSKISGLFVVARNSSFAYRGDSIEIRKVAEDLGVRYVLDGSIRREGDTIRINTQLVDALRGNHLWSERYDRKVADVFRLQSEVAEKIVKTLAVTLKAGEHERLFQKHITNIRAYDTFLQARRTVDHAGRENIERGEQLFKQVVDLDPNFAGGYAGLSFNYSVKVRFGYSQNAEEDKNRSLELARKGIELDPNFGWSHIALGGAYLANGDVIKAVQSVRAALRIAPNGYEENLFTGLYLMFAGESPLAVEHLETARRINPVDTVRNTAFPGMAYFMNGDYAKAEDMWNARLEKFPSTNAFSYVWLAATYVLLNKLDAAVATAEIARETEPGFNLSQWRYLETLRSEENRSRLYNAAKKAGIPEFPTSDIERPVNTAIEARPAMIVLPFVNMSGDPKQDYFSDGFTEDVTTGLARIPGFLVVARNTAFTYKGRALDARTLGRELGVRYVLEGSARQQGERLRVNTQLIETATGTHVWAERFDRPMKDLFIVQDSLVDRIIGTVAARLRRHESERAMSASKETLAAYDLTSRARLLFRRNTIEAMTEARKLLQRANKTDPSYAPAYSTLAQVEQFFFTSRVTDEYAQPETARRVLGAASRAVSLAPNDAFAHGVYGMSLRMTKDYDQAAREAKLARELAPNDPQVLAPVATILLSVGHYEASVETMRLAWALDPHISPVFTGAVLAQGLFALGKYRDSKEVALDCLAKTASDVRCLESLVRALGELGPADQAKKAVDELLRLSPDYTISEYKRRADKNRRDRAAIERWADGLRKAGVPE